MKKVFFVLTALQCCLIQAFATEQQTTPITPFSYNVGVVSDSHSGGLAQGGDLKAQHSPRCSFNWVIAAIAIKNGIIKSLTEPTIIIDKNVTPTERWHGPHTPRTWAEVSCVPYSRYLVRELGWHLIRKELENLGYGNEKFEAKNPALNLEEKPWIDGSLEISVLEQIKILNFILNSPDYLTAEQKKLLLAIFELKDEQLPADVLLEGKIYGKTGAGDVDEAIKLKGGWFIGAYENKDGRFIPFACYGEEIADDYAIAAKTKAYILKEVSNVQNNK